MKNLLLGLIATVLFAFEGNAQEKVDFDQKAEFKTGKIEIKSSKETTSYNYKTLNEFNEGSQNLFDQLNFENQEYSSKCEVTINVTVEVTVGVATISMSGSVTTSCSNAVAAARRLKEMLITAALN